MWQTSSSSSEDQEEAILLNPFSPQPYLLNQHHQCILTLKGQTSYTSSLLLHGKFLLTGSSNNEIRLLIPFHQHENPISDDIIHVEAGQGGAVKALVLSSDKIISAHQDNKIRVWKLDNIHDKNTKLTRLATLPTLGDRALKFLVPKNHVQITRHKTCTWVHHVDTVSSLALSRDGSLLYSVSWDRTMKIWRVTDFKCLESVSNAHDDAINAIVLSNDDTIYTGSSDKKIKIWKKNKDDRHYLDATLEKHNSGVNALALNRDGTVLFSGGCDESIMVWKKDGGGGSTVMMVVGEMKGHSKAILCLAVVSDLVCSGSADKTVRVWRGFGRTYSCLAVLEGHEGPVKCISVAFDHSSDTISTYLLYSASLDCDIKVWKIFCPPVSNCISMI